MVQTFSDDKYIYSVDMMFAYINIFKKRLKVTKLKVENLTDTLEYKGWGDPERGIKYSPQDVLKTPSKYPDEMKRIKNANLRFPIIVFSEDPKQSEFQGFIVDGVHRLTKAMLEERKHIRAYQFDKKMMKNFIIAKKGEWSKAEKMNTHDFIEKFYKQWCVT